MPKTYYLFDELGRYAGTSAAQTAYSTAKKPPEAVPAYNWNGYDWMLVPGLADGLPPNPHGQAVAAPQTVAVTPPEFKLLFTSAERIAIAQVRAGTGEEMAAVRAAFDDFFSILDDPRLTHVNLSLPSTQAGIEAVLQVLAGMGVVADIDERRAAILSGAVQ